MTIARYVGEILKKREDISNWKVLALGCGVGVGEVSYKWDHLTAVDIWDYSDGPFDKFIQLDVTKINKRFKPNSFELVLAFDIIEHLKKEEGWQLKKDAEIIAKCAVAFYTPLEWDTNEKNMQDKNAWCYGNPYNLHHSLWTPEEFEGYEIILIGEGFLAFKML